MLSSPLGVFTEHPEALFGASHVVLSQKHVLNQPKFYEVCVTVQYYHRNHHYQNSNCHHQSTK